MGSLAQHWAMSLMVLKDVVMFVSELWRWQEEEGSPLQGKRGGGRCECEWSYLDFYHSSDVSRYPLGHLCLTKPLR